MKDITETGKKYSICQCISYDDENALTLKSHFIENDDVLNRLAEIKFNN